MSTSIGSLTIEMAADIARLRRDMDDAKKVVGGAMAEMQRAANLLKTALGVLVGVASVNAFKGMVQSSIEGTAALKDLAQQTGATVEQLSGMIKLGKLSDTSAEQIAGAMNKLAKNMSTSSEESRGASAALRALGIDYAAFAAMSPDQQMQAVAKAMAGFKDGAGKSAAAMALYGKEGARLLPFLNDLAEQQDIAATATSAQAEMADHYADNLTILEKSGKAWQKQLAMGLLPALDETTEALLGVMNGSGGLKEQIKKLADDGTLARWARDAVTAISYIADGLQYAMRFITALGEYIGATAADAANLISGIGGAIKRVMSGDFAGAWDELVSMQRRSDAINAELAASINSAWDAKTLGANLRERIAEIQAAGTAAQEAKKNLDFTDPSKGKGGGEAADKMSEYDKLMLKIREKTALEQQELQTTQKLTEAQRIQIEVAQQLHAGKLKLNEAQRAAVAAALAELDLREREKARRDEEKRQRDDALKTATSELENVQKQIEAQREANAQIGLTASAIAELNARRLEKQATEKEEMAFWAQVSAMGPEVVQKYQEQAAALRELAKLKREGGQLQEQDDKKKADTKIVEDYLKQDIGTNLAAGFDKASQSLGTFVQTFGKLIDAQDKYNEARRAAGNDATKLAEIDLHNQRQQINAYGSLAGAAKGFFKEGSKGYKAMEAAERAFRAIELAMAIQNALEKIGLIESVTAAKVAGDAAQTDSLLVSAGKQIAAFFGIGTASAAAGVANQAQGDPYTAFPRMAAMAAIMAGLGFATGAFGGGGSSPAPTNNGTGTVLGDVTKQSESIAKSLELLGNVDTMTMRYSAQMLAALKSIEASISGVTTLLVRSGGLDTATSGIQVGATRATGLQGLIGFDNRMVGNLVSTLPIIGGALKGLLSRDFQKLFGSSQSITGSGITGSPQTLASIFGSGFQASYYADIQSKRKFLGMTTSTSSSTRLTDADAELERQFTLILTGFADAVSAAAGPLGVSLNDVQNKLSSFVVDLGRIGLQGLTGDQINEKLTAVFGAAGDNIAKAALGGFEAFQAVGEGYLETVVRVASGAEQARVVLARLGVQAVALAKVEDKQGDVGAELTRQSLVAAEGLSGISDILKAMSGTADDVSQAYVALVDLRTALTQLGLNGSAVGADLLSGAGGLQALSDAVNAYQDNFGTAAERMAVQSATLRDQFKRLGLAMPTSADDFKSLVKGIDTSSDAGKALLGSVLSLSSGFAKLLSALKDTTSGIADEIARIKGLQTGSGDATYAALQAQFAIATAQARAGDTAAIDALPGLSQSLLDAAKTMAASNEDLATIQATTLASLEDTMRAIAKAQGLDVPGFAAGGDFTGGLRLVGENGPELEVTGPSRIFNAQQTSDLLASSNQALVAEVRALRSEVSALRQENQVGHATTAGNTGKTARLLERVMPDGDAIATRAAT